MEKTFLSKEQISTLEEIQWDVIPNPVYIKLYQDELPSIVWVLLNFAFIVFNRWTLKASLLIPLLSANIS